MQYTVDMHIYFSGIGGAGIGPLAQIAQQAGFDVSGSDKQDSQYIQYLKKNGISDIHIGQSTEQIKDVHEKKPIDWYVYSSALVFENPDAPELLFCKDQSIKTSKRDELLNMILQEKDLGMIAIAGTHGKTTTTAMVTWIIKQLGLPISYLLPAKTSFAEMGEYDPESRFFVYEADEFDRNFLAFEPKLSLITGVSWDHHEIFPTREDYQSAFREFIDQSGHTFLWGEDAEYLSLGSRPGVHVLDSGDKNIDNITLLGRYNRLDAMLAVQAIHKATDEPLDRLVEIVSRFPGLSRRMEKIAPNLYSDYAHTPEKIIGAMSVASEMAAESGKDLVILYEPLTNRRQHYMLDSYKNVFTGASKIYWLPSYLAREDKNQRIIPPEELISHLDEFSKIIAEPTDMNNHLKHDIENHLKNGDMVVAMVGGGGGSLDDWLRNNFA